MTIAVADIGTGSQLYNPCWMKQSEIKQYIQTKAIGNISDMVIGLQRMVEEDCVENIEMVVCDISPPITKDISIT